MTPADRGTGNNASHTGAAANNGDDVADSAHAEVNRKKSDIIQNLQTFLLQTQAKQISKCATDFIFKQFHELEDIINKLLVDNATLKGNLETYKSVLEGNSSKTSPAKDSLSASIQETVRTAIHEEMKASLHKQTNSSDESDTRMATYASIVDSSIPVHRQAPIKVIVEPRQETKGAYKNMEDLKRGIKSSLKPSTMGIKIRNLYTTEKGVIIETETNKEAEKIISTTSLKNLGVNVKLKPRRLPRIIIYDVPVEHDEENLRELFWTQNAENMDNRDKEKFNPLFKQGPKDRDVVHWVVEVTPNIRNLVKKSGRIFLDWLSCSVKDWISVTRCYKCQGFGHTKKFCRADETTCAHCGKLSHEANQCPDKGNHASKCINCTRAKREADHPASSKTCPSYKTALERLIRMTQYE